MVTRKPVPGSSDPPYPVTPIKTSSFHIQDASSQLLPSATDSSATNSPWATEGGTNSFTEPSAQEVMSSLHPGLKAPQTGDSSLPLSLQAGGGRQAASGRSSMERPSYEHLPESLRPGPPSDTPRTSQDAERPALKPTNPFFRGQKTGQSGSQGGESSATAWGGESEIPPAPAAPPPPPPTLEGGSEDPTAELLQKLSIQRSESNPWGTPVPANPHLLQTSSDDSATEAWSAAPPEREAPAPPVGNDDRRSSVSSQDSDDWNDERAGSVSQLSSSQVQSVSAVNEEPNAWENHEAPQKSEAKMQAEHANHIEHVANEPDGWQEPSLNVILVDAEPIQAATEPIEQEKIRPPLPPRLESEDEAPPKPPRSAANTSSDSTESHNELLKETYEIKKIRWHDAGAPSNPRTSPILVQNANGPCPLVALVNALTLSTPADMETALVERLRSREQVSLRFLLEGVIDELMSGRRSDGAHKLPDPSDLFSFLITLHTGMNVNPMFFPPGASKSTSDPRNSMSHVHPVERESVLPGSFEETREMKLYGTFSVPLIHGWLPSEGSPAYEALARSAKSYEDAQNIMFREDELEEKLSRESLSFEEQATLEDIFTIKAFLSSNPTQLTTNGLETITTSMIPGSVAILFRNDHFSTLYRHPSTMQLYQLVTDMGYAGHDEVVWESLADVNGENCEFFSGDFRIVGENAEYHNANEEFTTQSKNKGRSTDASSSSAVQQYNPPPGPPPGHRSGMQSPTTEQEDHDLALALQLQEEEEEQQRNDIARRKRESEYSERFIEQQASTSGNIPVTVQGRGGTGRGGSMRGGGARRNQSESHPISQSNSVSSRPAVPPRRGGSLANTSSPAGRRTSSAATPAVQHPTSRVDPEAGEDAPPPSYELASSQAAYIPPVDHPAHPSTNPSVAQAAATANQSTGPPLPARRTGNFSQANGNVVYGGPGGGRRADNRTSSSSGGLVSSAANSNASNGGNGPQGKKENCRMM